VQVLYPWTKLSGLARFAIIINSLAATVFLISLLVSSSGVCGATMEYKKTVGRSTRNSQHRIFQMKLFQEFAELESKHGANQPVKELDVFDGWPTLLGDDSKVALVVPDGYEYV
jgi:hypothetical protein